MRFSGCRLRKERRLRHEVESLLAGETAAEASFTAPAADALTHQVHPTADTIPDIARPGLTVGSYRIERLLGRGGMGAVVLAYDTTLHRPVALKVLDEPAEGKPRAADSCTRPATPPR